jgi:hypothetical protein
LTWFFFFKHILSKKLTALRNILTQKTFDPSGYHLRRSHKRRMPRARNHT